MSNPNPHLTRRRFLKAAGLLGVGSLIAGGATLADTSTDGGPAKASPHPVPTRPFGKTGTKLPMLALGGLDVAINPLLLKQALDWGLTYWDTANMYLGGNSEIGLGQYFEKNPNARKQVFLVTKTESRNPAVMTKHLELSLERMKTDHIDLYFIHYLFNPGELTPGIKEWAEKAKKTGQIRFFGFSTHSNMEASLLGAAKLGWIDGIMLKYDFRLRQTDPMRQAVDACAKAGVGLTAMKTQAAGPVKVDSETELKMAGRFLQQGFTDAQARLKAVWENEQISVICSSMSNLSILMANIGAALDKTKLTALDHELMQRYAGETRCGYCAGCTQRCEEAIARQAPIGDVLRCLMYYRSYGDRDLARQLFAQVPANTREQLTRLDYSTAEQRCPNGLPIARLMREASDLLS